MSRFKQSKWNRSRVNILESDSIKACETSSKIIRFGFNASEHQVKFIESILSKASDAKVEHNINLVSKWNRSRVNFFKLVSTKRVKPSWVKFIESVSNKRVKQNSSKILWVRLQLGKEKSSKLLSQLLPFEQLGKWGNGLLTSKCLHQWTNYITRKFRIFWDISYWLEFNRGN